ncbi:hypothetical protein FM104_14210 [Microbacterium esteraromaticum]|uniref:DUF7882 domain-containing protein n=1 Tax=Microbacterium esteraromaticum TaxID=57043 RepID=A0A1R4KN75_9MICO|nr:hypothetical protein [Microbacterium esteraromaticum]MDN5895901.1 hypothetical protein [Nocardioides sp.]SJN45692.1 hypothetical protein FM104_14210 [Microbacterium esteraromaticum]
MGRFAPLPDGIEVEDRELAHLEAIIHTKFRRKESFMLVPPPDPGQPAGYVALWFHPSMAVQFAYDTAEHFPLDELTLQQMTDEWIEAA